MIPESIQSLLKSLHEKGLDAIVAGGLAVNAHGFARLTSDADLLIRADHRDKATETLTNLGFTLEGSTNVASRFSHQSYIVPHVDLLWTETQTFNVFLASTILVNGHAKTLSLPHLIAMKLHTIAENEDRFAKDSEDIKFLLKHNPRKIASEEYQTLVNKFAPDQHRDYLLGLQS